MTNTKDHLHTLIKDFRSAMLTTRAGNGGLHVRPMAVAKLSEGEELYFATGLGTPKVEEISRNPDVTVTFQSSSEFAVLYGMARLVRDSALITELWSEAWRVWFPGGKDDPNLCLLAITPSHAEYWDNSGLEGFKYLFSGLKAVLQKRTPETDESQHAQIRL
jgi:general stress protein 26